MERPPVTIFEHKGVNYVLDGHHRLQAARIVGLTEVPYESIPLERLSQYGYGSVEELLTAASEAFGL